MCFSLFLLSMLAMSVSGHAVCPRCLPSVCLFVMCMSASVFVWVGGCCCRRQGLRFRSGWLEYHEMRTTGGWHRLPWGRGRGRYLCRITGRRPALPFRRQGRHITSAVTTPPRPLVPVVLVVSGGGALVKLKHLPALSLRPPGPGRTAAGFRRDTVLSVFSGLRAA